MNAVEDINSYIYIQTVYSANISRITILHTTSALHAERMCTASPLRWALQCFTGELLHFLVFRPSFLCGIECCGMIQFVPTCHFSFILSNLQENLLECLQIEGFGGRAFSVRSCSRQMRFFCARMLLFSRNSLIAFVLIGPFTL